MFESILKGAESRKGSAYPLSDDDRPMILVIKEGRKVITPFLAQRILAECDYSGQRKTKDHHVTLLRDDMQRRTWIPGSQIAFALCDGRLYLLNGRHRMHAVIASQRDIEFQILILDAEDEAEIARLYYHFDVVLRRRSTAEILHSVGVAAEHGISKGMAKAVYDAVALIGNGLLRPNYQNDPVGARSVDRRLEGAKAWWPIAAQYEDMIDGAHHEIAAKLRQQGCVACALVTIKYQPDKAKEFWAGVALNDGLRIGDPRRTLNLDLLTRHKNIGPFEQTTVVPSIAWNAWFDGKPLKLIRVYEKSVPVLKGTPFDGRRRKSA